MKTFDLNSIHNSIIRKSVIVAVFFTSTLTSFAQDSTKIEMPRLDDMEQRLRIIERKAELDQDAQEAKAKEIPIVGANGDGFSITSLDKKFVLKWRTGIQIDGRSYLGDEEKTISPNLVPNDNFILRRLRTSLDATVYKYYSFRFNPDFGSGTTAIIDAYVDVTYVPWLKFRAGKFIPPFGLERQQSYVDVPLVEQAYTTQLTPNRDVGAQVFGDFSDGAYSYQIAVYNGAADNVNGDNDNNSEKDIAARIFALPFKNGESDWARNLGLGFAVTAGDHIGDTASATNLSAVKTPGQQSLFAYAAKTRAFGKETHLSPQGYWYAGSFGILGEYVWTSQEVKRVTDPIVTFEHNAWQTTVSYVVTGETPGYKSLKPRHDFLDNGGIGAIELVANISQIKFDNKAFEKTTAVAAIAAVPATPTTPAKAAVAAKSAAAIYADDTKSATEALTFGAGISWYLNRNLKLASNYYRTQFKKGSAGSTDRKEENFWAGRVQFIF